MQLATSSRGRLYFHQLFPVIVASLKLFQNHLDTVPCQVLCWSRNVGPNALLWSLPACPIPGFCDSVMQSWDLIHTQPGHRQGTHQQHAWGFWSSTEVQENLKPILNSEEVNWGTDVGFQQQPMVIIQSYSFYKKITFLVWFCGLKSPCDFGFLNWMLTSGFLFLPALLVILHMDKGGCSPTSVCVLWSHHHQQPSCSPCPAWHIPGFQESPALGSPGAVQAKEWLQGKPSAVVEGKL